MPNMRLSEPLTLTLFGLTLPIPRWSVAGFGVLALAGAAGFLYQQFFPTPLVTLQEANHALSMELREYNTHLFETTEWRQTVIDDARGTLGVGVYADGCVVISRMTRAGTQTQLIPDLSRPDMQHVDGDDVAVRREVDILPVALAQGRCIDPHPGKFETTYGEKSGCVVEVWRRFEDGCEHIQLFDVCSNTWHVNADGSPRVRWTRCVH